MRLQFKEFYKPSQDQLDDLWKNATFVFDTNVLLDLYRLPNIARHEYLELLKALKDRVWIPHHVGLEFNLRRPDAIVQHNKALGDKADKIKSSLISASREIRALEIDKQLGDHEATPIIEAISELQSIFNEKSAKIIEINPSLSNSDPIHEAISDIFSGRIGESYDKSELDDVLKEGEKRYSQRVPPGFMDEAKEKDSEPNFCHGGCLYPRKFGDYLIWRQTLEHFRKDESKKLIFITGDKKEDWWWKRGSVTIGPLPQLCREAYDLGTLELFWMYSPGQFARFARDHLHAQLSDESIREIKLVSRTPIARTSRSESSDRKTPMRSRSIATGRLEQSLVNIVANWHRDIFPDTQVTGSYPDITYSEGGFKTGMEVISVYGQPDDSFFKIIESESQRGKKLIQDEVVDFFEIALIIQDSSLENLQRFASCQDRVTPIIGESDSGVDVSISICYLNEDDEFMIFGVIKEGAGFESWM